MSQLGDIIDTTKYALVSGTSVVTDEIVIPTGEVWEIQKFIGNAGQDMKSIVQLVWKYQKPVAQRVTLALTHGDHTFEDIPSFTGDGTDVLAIVLRNDATKSHRLIGRYIGEVVKVP